MSNHKHPVKSKTLWFNGVATAALAGFTVVESQISLLQPELAPRVYLGALFALAAINAGLRFVTTTALSLKAHDHDHADPHP